MSASDVLLFKWGLVGTFFFRQLLTCLNFLDKIEDLEWQKFERHKHSTPVINFSRNQVTKVYSTGPYQKRMAKLYKELYKLQAWTYWAPIASQGLVYLDEETF